MTNMTNKTVGAVYITHGVKGLDSSQKTIIQAVFPSSENIDSDGNITVDPRAKRFTLVADGLKPIGDWDDGSSNVSAESLVDYGIHVSTQPEPNTEVLEEIAQKFKLGAISGQGVSNGTINIDVTFFPSTRLWSVPVLPSIDDVEPTADISDREEYKRPTGEIYYGRPFGRTDDVRWLRELREDEDHCLLLGEPGVGKTALAEAAFPDLISMVCSSGTTTSDLVGQFIPCPKTKENPTGFVWVPGPLSIACEYGRPLLLDEVMRVADPDELSPIFPTTDGRGVLKVEANPSIGEIKVKKGYYLIACANVNEVGSTISKALEDRLVEHVDVRSDYALMRGLGVHSKFVQFAERMEGLRVAGETNWAPQARSCLRVNRIINRSGLSHAIANELGKCPEISRPLAIQTARSVFEIESPSILALA